MIVHYHLHDSQLFAAVTFVLVDQIIAYSLRYNNHTTSAITYRSNQREGGIEARVAISNKTVADAITTDSSKQTTTKNQTQFC